MKDKLKIIIINIAWFFSHIFYVFPIDRNKIMFLSYDGKQYSDSPKCISDYYKHNNPELKQVWAFKKDFSKKNMGGKNRDIIICKKKTARFLYHLFTSKEIVINDFLSTAFKLRKGQILLNTWHGGGTFKTIGMSRSNLTDYDEFFYKAHARNTSAFSLSSEYFRETVVTRSFLFNGETLPYGMPRNAILFKKNRGVREKVIQSYNLPLDEDILIVLYAPTYRYDTQSSKMDKKYELIDFDICRKAFKQRSGKKTFILNRSHHAMIGSQAMGEYLDATYYPDMQELIIASDILISDYSSCMWDFALTKKPIFIYAPDLHNYENNVNFFMPVSKWAFSIAMNNRELEENIIIFDEYKYMKDLAAYMAPLRSYENADAVIKTCKWLDEKRWG